MTEGPLPFQTLPGDKVIPGRPLCAGSDVERDFGRGVVTDEMSPNAIRAAANAHRFARDAWREIARQTIAIATTDDDWPAKRRARAEEIGAAKEREVIAAADEAIKAANMRLAAIHADFEKALAETPVSQARSAELRAVIRQLPEAERIALGARQSFANDPELARALAGAHPLLTGLPPETHERARMDYLRATKPDQFAEMQAIEKAGEQVERAREAFGSYLQQWRAGLKTNIPDLR